MDVPPDGGGGDRPAFHQNVRFIVHDERSAPKPVAVASGSSADTRMVIDLTGDDVRNVQWGSNHRMHYPATKLTLARAVALPC